MSELLSTAEAAEYCGIPVRTWERYFRTWGVPHFRIGRALKFRQSELETWLESRREG